MNFLIFFFLNKLIVIFFYFKFKKLISNDEIFKKVKEWNEGNEEKISIKFLSCYLAEEVIAKHSGKKKDNITILVIDLRALKFKKLINFHAKKKKAGSPEPKKSPMKPNKFNWNT